MIYLDGASFPDATASMQPILYNGGWQDILIISLPPTALDATFALFAEVAEITDEQPQTITRYRPAICYSVADEGGRTYAKLRISSRTTAENPAWYAAQTAAATAENGELLSLLGGVADQEYVKAMEEINHV